MFVMLEVFEFCLQNSRMWRTTPPDDNDDDALTEFNFRVKGNISWKSFAIFKRRFITLFVTIGIQFTLNQNTMQTTNLVSSPVAFFPRQTIRGTSL